MKKILCFCLSVVLGLGLWFSANRPKFADFSGTYSVYLGAYSSKARIENADGILYYTYFNKTGESCVINGAMDKTEIFKMFSAREVFSEETGGGVCYYGYTDEIAYFEIINGNKINLHIFICESRTVVGTPLIYGSF